MYDYIYYTYICVIHRYFQLPTLKRFGSNAPKSAIENHLDFELYICVIHIGVYIYIYIQCIHICIMGGGYRGRVAYVFVKYIFEYIYVYIQYIHMYNGGRV